jgi:tRNA nucleotidyltransferase (CCA-adding enzyme)
MTIKKVEDAIKREQVLASVRVGGSIAKGTYLAHDHDVDVFVRFSTDYADAELPDHLERILKRAFDARAIERVHGSRDYFHVHIGRGKERFLFEFIPVLNIGSWQEARNVTDMSPLHVDYVAHHTDERPWLASEIRLTKQFCKAGKIYGAESYIGGFSGHVVDLLNIHYGGFRQLLEAAAAWGVKTVIDPERHHTNPLTALNDAKTYAPLVIVDPVQADRNSAAAVTKLAYDRLRELAKRYLAATPSEQEAFFTVVPLNIAALRAQHKSARDVRILSVVLTPQDGKKDVVGAKCAKVLEHCTAELLRAEFQLIATHWEFTPAKATLVFVVPQGLLPAQVEMRGPPVHKTADVARFNAAHKTVLTRASRLVAIDKRKWRDPGKLLAHLCAGAYVRERVKRATVKT